MEKSISQEDLDYANEFRKYYTGLNPTAGDRDPLKSVHDIIFKNTKYRIYTPKEIDVNAPTILFIHGGGYISGDIETHDVLASSLANRNNAVTVSIEYGLAPEHRFPKGLEECYSAILWIKDYIQNYQGNSNKIVIAGDSAGGGLTISLAYLIEERNPNVNVIGLICIYPVTSFFPDSESFNRLGVDHFPQSNLMDDFGRLYVENPTLLKNPLVSTIYGDVSNLPPTLLLVGENDPLQSHIEIFSKNLKDSGVYNEFIIYPGMEHGFVQYFKAEENLEQGTKAIEKIKEFIIRFS